MKLKTIDTLRIFKEVYGGPFMLFSNKELHFSHFCCFSFFEKWNNCCTLFSNHAYYLLMMSQSSPLLIRKKMPKLLSSPKLTTSLIGASNGKVNLNAVKSGACQFFNLNQRQHLATCSLHWQLACLGRWYSSFFLRRSG